MKKPLILIIMDGFGIAPEKGNAIKAANKPNLDKLFSTCPITQIGASGMDVGLPDGQMGNSEVGHTNMGAGRVVYQELTRITKSIGDGDFFNNEALVEAVENCKAKQLRTSPYGTAFRAAVFTATTPTSTDSLSLQRRGALEKVYIHAFLDGRDVPPSSAKDYAEGTC